MFGKNNKDEKICPFLKKACIKEQCMMYQTIEGVHPLTGKQIKESNCTFNNQILFLMELGRQLEGLRIINEEQRNQSAKMADNIISSIQLIKNGYTYISSIEDKRE